MGVTGSPLVDSNGSPHILMACRIYRSTRSFRPFPSGELNLSPPPLSEALLKARRELDARQPRPLPADRGQGFKQPTYTDLLAWNLQDQHLQQQIEASRQPPYLWRQVEEFTPLNLALPSWGKYIAQEDWLIWDPILKRQPYLKPPEGLIYYFDLERRYYYRTTRDPGTKKLLRSKEGQVSVEAHPFPLQEIPEVFLLVVPESGYQDFLDQLQGKGLSLQRGQVLVHPQKGAHWDPTGPLLFLGACMVDLLAAVHFPFQTMANLAAVQMSTDPELTVPSDPKAGMAVLEHPSKAHGANPEWQVVMTLKALHRTARARYGPSCLFRPCSTLQP